MHLRNTFAAACVVAAAGTWVFADQRDLGREVLAANDGWASLGEGVTDGSLADTDHVYVVRNRAEFLAALGAVSYNRFRDHDKTMLIGSSDNAPRDVGRLRITLHHNLFENLGQRAPRVRYGQVHVYNNYYRIQSGDSYNYSWGVGVQPLPVTSGIFAENNFFRSEKEVTPDQFIARFTNGRSIHVDGTLYNAAAGIHAVDPLAEFNAVRDPDLGGDVGWTPTLFLPIDPTYRVPSLIESQAGPFNG